MQDYRRGTLTIGPRLTPAVKCLILSCVGVFCLSAVGAGREMILIFGLTPHSVLTKLFLWQPLTYLFFHADFYHILMNLFVLWMFGCEMERYLGSREFVRFFFITGAGAGLLSLLAHPFSNIPTIGASGAIYGILLAYGILFSERRIYLYFFIPVKVKYFVAGLFSLAFLSALSSTGSPVDNVAHLGGGLFAFLYLKGLLSWQNIHQIYRRWQAKRSRKNFRVYEKKTRPRDDDYWIN
jgi:membrane associated rhomboid family serine protease